MSRLTIDTGTAGNPATGDSLRTAFNKVNTNFTELYAELGGDSLDAISFNNNTISTDITNANLILTGNGTGGVVIGDLIFSGNKISTVSSNANIDLDPAGTGNIIVKSGNFLPATDNTQYLGSVDKRWHTLYVGPGSININGVSITESGGKISLGTSTSISGTLEVNEIASADSSAIQINDGVNISGNVHLQGNTITLGNITESSLDQSLTMIYGAFGLSDYSGNHSMAMSITNGKMVFEGNNINGYALVPSNNNQYTLGNPSEGPGDPGKFWKNLYLYNLNFPDSSEQTTAARITIVGDDSTGTTFNAGETIKIAGAGSVTTAVSGDTLIITGTAGGGGTITLVGDDSSGTAVNVGETFKIAGTQNITTAVSGDTLTITGSKNIEVNEISSGDSTAIQINDAVNVSGAGTFHGSVRFNAGYTENINALTSNSTITVNCALASVHTVTLAVSTGFVISNLPTGGTVTLIITQGGSGSYTATFSTDGSTTVKFPGGAPTLSTAVGAIDVVTIFNDGTNYLGNIAKAYA